MVKVAAAVAVVDATQYSKYLSHMLLVAGNSVQRTRG